MDYGRPLLADRLAAEYVLGTLRGPARRRFQTLMTAHPALRTAVRGWEARLLPLGVSIPPVEPPQHLWAAIEQRAFPAARPAAAPPRGWRRLGLWQGLSAAGFAAVVWLLLARGPLGPEPPAPLAALPPPPPPRLAEPPAPPPPATPPLLLVLDPQAAPAGRRLPVLRFAAALSADGRALVLRPLSEARLASNRALELWAVPAAGAPRSLGLVSADEGTTVLQALQVEGTSALAISLEPAGGSPTGAPTGPVLAVGALPPR